MNRIRRALFALLPTVLTYHQAQALAHDPALSTGAKAHSLRIQVATAKPDLPASLSLLWEARPNLGTVEEIAVSNANLVLISGSRGDAVALDAQGHARWSKSFASVWLIPLFVTPYGFAGVVSPFSVVGLSASGAQVFNTTLPTEPNARNLTHAALSNGGLAIAAGRRLWVLDPTGAITTDLALPNTALALIEANQSLCVVLTSGEVFTLSAFGTLADKGIIRGKLNSAVRYARSELLVAMPTQINSLNLVSRQINRLLTLKVPEQIQTLAVNLAGFQFLSQSGTLTRVDRSGVSRFSLALRVPSSPTTAPPLMATDDHGNTAVASEDGKITLVNRDGLVLAEQSVPCSSITALAQGPGRLLVGCGEGKLVALGVAKR